MTLVWNSREKERQGEERKSTDGRFEETDGDARHLGNFGWRAVKLIRVPKDEKLCREKDKRQATKTIRERGRGDTYKCHLKFNKYLDF